MYFRGVRGANLVKSNSTKEILASAKHLLEEMLVANDIQEENIASIIFTLSPDLNAAFPAKSARMLGLNYTPLICATEINVPESMKKCIRILMHINTKKQQKEIKHIFIGETKKLRPDITQ